MELLSVLMMEGHIPAKTFCSALMHMRTYTMNVTPDDTNIYRALVGDCLTEYNFHRSSLNSRQHICDSTIGRACPVCQKNPPIVSMDGNFGLVHKASSGQGHGQASSRHYGLFFQSQSALNTFMASYVADRKNQSADCSSFQAGNIIGSKVKTSKLDIKGVFGSVCKHDVPLLFLNMSHGERLGYSVFVLKQLLQNRDDHVTVLYDIACTLHKHLQKNNQGIAQKCQFAVPLFHSFAHNIPCQLNFRQRYAEGTGLTDGEGIERLWAYLRGFKKITKEMTIANREDLLTEAMLHHTEKTIWNLASRFMERFKKAKDIVKECEAVLADILSSEQVSLESVDGWFEDWKMSSEKTTKRSLTLTDEEQYVEALHMAESQRQKMDNSVTGEEREIQEKLLKRTDKEIQRLSKKNVSGIDLSSTAGHAHLTNAKMKRRLFHLMKLRSFATDRQYLSILMKKYADGQAVGLRVSR